MQEIENTVSHVSTETANGKDAKNFCWSVQLHEKEQKRKRRKKKVNCKALCVNTQTKKTLGQL